MEKLEVVGVNMLKGQVRISGSKNASLPILAATLLSDKKIQLSNLPKVKDIEIMLLLLKTLDTEIKYLKNNKLVSIENNKKNKTFVSYSLVKTMRAGILVLGPLLARYSKAKISLPGGCAIGTRPIDIHLKALSKLGVRYKIVQGYVYANAPKGLVGAKIKFPKISVGATENLIIAASLAKGQTVLSNCAIEPEIKDLVNFLNKMGCKINWIGKRKVKILGVKKLNEVNYKIMPDRIEAGTYLIAAAVTFGDITISDIQPSRMNNILDKLKRDDVLGIAVDTYALWWDARLKEEIQRAGSRLLNFHVSDWLYETRDIRLDRGMPGDGQIDNALIRSWMMEAGYKGAVEVEILSALDWWQKPADTVVRKICERISFL